MSKLVPFPMILHVLINDAQIESLSIAKRSFLSLEICAFDSIQTLKSDWNGSSTIVRFHQTIHVPLSSSLLTQPTKLKFSLIKSRSQSVNSILGESTIKVNPDNHSETRVLKLTRTRKDGLEEQTCRLSITIFYYRYPLDLTDRSLLQNQKRVLPPTCRDPENREYAFLLARRLNWPIDKPSSFDGLKEKQLDEDVTMNLRELHHSVHDELKGVKRRVTGSRTATAKGTATGKSTGGNDIPKNRSTNMAVGYLGVSWPDSRDFKREKTMYRLYLAEERRLQAMRQLAEEFRARSERARERTALTQQIRFQRAESDEKLKQLLTKKEKEIRGLEQELKATKHLSRLMNSVRPMKAEEIMRSPHTDVDLAKPRRRGTSSDATTSYRRSRSKSQSRDAERVMSGYSDHVDEYEYPRAGGDTREGPRRSHTRSQHSERGRAKRAHSSHATGRRADTRMRARRRAASADPVGERPADLAGEHRRSFAHRADTQRTVSRGQSDVRNRNSSLSVTARSVERSHEEERQQQRIHGRSRAMTSGESRRSGDERNRSRSTPRNSNQTKATSGNGQSKPSKNRTSSNVPSDVAYTTLRQPMHVPRSGQQGGAASPKGTATPWLSSARATVHRVLSSEIPGGNLDERGRSRGSSRPRPSASRDRSRSRAKQLSSTREGEEVGTRRGLSSKSRRSTKWDRPYEDENSDLGSLLSLSDYESENGSKLAHERDEDFVDVQLGDYVDPDFEITDEEERQSITQRRPVTRLAAGSSGGIGSGISRGSSSESTSRRVTAMNIPGDRRRSSQYPGGASRQGNSVRYTPREGEGDMHSERSEFGALDSFDQRGYEIIAPASQVFASLAGMVGAGVSDALGSSGVRTDGSQARLDLTSIDDAVPAFLHAFGQANGEQLVHVPMGPNQQALWDLSLNSTQPPSQVYSEDSFQHDQQQHQQQQEVHGSAAYPSTAMFGTVSSHSTTTINGDRDDTDSLTSFDENERARTRAAATSSHHGLLASLSATSTTEHSKASSSAFGYRQPARSHHQQSLHSTGLYSVDRELVQPYVHQLSQSHSQPESQLQPHHQERLNARRQIQTVDQLTTSFFDRGTESSGGGGDEGDVWGNPALAMAYVQERSLLALADVPSPRPHHEALVATGTETPSLQPPSTGAHGHRLTLDQARERDLSSVSSPAAALAPYTSAAMTTPVHEEGNDGDSLPDIIAQQIEDVGSAIKQLEAKISSYISDIGSSSGKSQQSPQPLVPQSTFKDERQNGETIRVGASMLGVASEWRMHGDSFAHTTAHSPPYTSSHSPPYTSSHTPPYTSSHTPPYTSSPEVTTTTSTSIERSVLVSDDDNNSARATRTLLTDHSRQSMIVGVEQLGLGTHHQSHSSGKPALVESVVTLDQTPVSDVDTISTPQIGQQYLTRVPDADPDPALHRRPLSPLAMPDRTPLRASREKLRHFLSRETGAGADSIGEIFGRGTANFTDAEGEAADNNDDDGEEEEKEDDVLSIDTLELLSRPLGIIRTHDSSSSSSSSSPYSSDSSTPPPSPLQPNSIPSLRSTRNPSVDSPASPDSLDATKPHDIDTLLGFSSSRKSSGDKRDQGGSPAVDSESNSSTASGGDQGGDLVRDSDSDSDNDSNSYIRTDRGRGRGRGGDIFSDSDSDSDSGSDRGSDAYSDSDSDKDKSGGINSDNDINIGGPLSSAVDANVPVRYRLSGRYGNDGNDGNDDDDDGEYLHLNRTDDMNEFIRRLGQERLGLLDTESALAAEMNGRSDDGNSNGSFKRGGAGHLHVDTDDDSNGWIGYDSVALEGPIMSNSNLPRHQLPASAVTRDGDFPLEMGVDDVDVASYDDDVDCRSIRHNTDDDGASSHFEDAGFSAASETLTRILTSEVMFDVLGEEGSFSHSHSTTKSTESLHRNKHKFDDLHDLKSSHDSIGNISADSSPPASLDNTSDVVMLRRILLGGQKQEDDTMFDGDGDSQEGGRDFMDEVDRDTDYGVLA